MSESFFAYGDEPANPEHEVSPERVQIVPTLNIIVPENLEIDDIKVRTVISEIVNTQSVSIPGLRSQQIDYTGQRVYPNPLHINVDEIKGTDYPEGFAGIIEGIGKPVNHRRKPYTIETTLQYLQNLVALAQDPENQKDLNREIFGIGLAMYNRTFLVDEDGRSRILALKTLSGLGCHVTISGIKVNLLERTS